MSKLKPITPGEILLEEFLKPMELSQYRLGMCFRHREKADILPWRPSRREPRLRV
jgi:plasmid maintenance system antidote protein VapI